MIDRAGIPARYGPVRQLAFVPADFDAALNFWTEVMGVGPFYRLDHIAFDSVRYLGQPIAYDTSAAIAFWGDIEIELLRQHDDGPSILNQWLRDGREGIHHIRIQVDDLAECRDDLVARGGAVVQEAVLPGGSAYAMIAMPGPAPMIEVSFLDPAFDRLFAFMKGEARRWDGSAPLRLVPPEAEWTR